MDRYLKPSALEGMRDLHTPVANGQTPVIVDLALHVATACSAVLL